MHELTIPYLNRKHSETVLCVTPWFYLLVPNLYILCCFPHIPVLNPQTVCLLLPCARASRGGTEMRVDGPCAAVQVPASPRARQRWRQASGHQCAALLIAARVYSQALSWHVGTPDEKCVTRGGRREWKLLLRESALALKGLSVRRSGAAIEWRAGSRQAPHLIFLLGAQVDKLAALFAAFFPVSPLYRKNC